MFKKIICGFTFAAAMLAFALPMSAAFPEEVRQALRLCATDIQTALANSSLPKNLPVALLPIRGDDDAYTIGLIKNAVTGAGLQCVEGKEDAFVTNIWAEVEWDERKNDILDTNTIAKFGQLQAAKLLMYAVLRQAGEGGRAYAEIELHVSSIETKKHLWGQVFSRRFYTNPGVTGLIKLDHDVRQAITKSFDETATRLKANEKLSSIKTIAIVPLAGDSEKETDQFITGLAESMISKTQYFPKQLDTPTLGEARALLRDDPKVADAILFGAVRELSIAERPNNIHLDRVEHEINAIVQLTIQDIKTGNILWSDLVESRYIDVKTNSMFVTLTNTMNVTSPMMEVVTKHKWYVIVPIIAVGAFFVLVVFMWMMRRSR